MFRFLVGVFLGVSVLVGSARGDITAADADFDGSGVVDVADFLQFVNGFGKTAGEDGYDEKFDFDGSGSVDFADFLQFVNVFGQTVQDVGSVDGDRAALVALYNATDGANWIGNTNWLSDKPLGEWDGVGTNAQGRVDTLALPVNQLSGSIPSELGNLSNLEELWLRENQLLGAIPSELGNLSNLGILSLGDNQLSGAIPSSLGNLSKLGALSLYDNQLSGAIPSELGNLSNLEFLYLDGNQLSGPVPSTLGNLSKLVYLELGGNPGLCMPSALQNWKFYNIQGVAKCSE